MNNAVVILSHVKTAMCPNAMHKIKVSRLLGPTSAARVQGCLARDVPDVTNSSSVDFFGAGTERFLFKLHSLSLTVL